MFAVTPWITKRTVPVPTLPMGPPYPPFISPLGEEFGHLIQRYFRGLPEFAPPPAVRHWGLEVTEEEEAIVVRAEAPGFEPEDFEILVTENQLVVRAAMTIEPVTLAGHREVVMRDEAGRVSRHFVILCFASRWVAGETRLNEELDEARWIRPSELKDLRTTEGLDDIVAAAFERMETMG